MNKSFVFFSIAAAILMFGVSERLAGQQKTIPVVKKPNPVANSVPVVPDVSLFAGVNYDGAKLPEVDAVYKTIENNLALPKGNGFTVPYFVFAGFRFSPSEVHALRAEFGGSVLRTAKDTSTNFLRVYYAGGSYQYSLPLGMVSIFAGGGLGYMWLNTERTYINRTGVARVNGRLVQMHALLGIEFFDRSGVSFALEGQYRYAATVAPVRSDLDLTIKGASVGIKIGIPLIMSL